MQRIKLKQSQITLFQKRIIEKKEEIKGKEVRLEELGVQKEQVLRNISEKKSQKQNVPQGEQFDRNRSQIDIQINLLLRKQNEIGTQIKNILAQKTELNKDIKWDEEQISNLSKHLVSLRRGAQLTDALRKQFDAFFSKAKICLDSHFEQIYQTRQESWFKREKETIDKYLSISEILNEKLIQKQSEQIQQIHPFLDQLRKKLNSSSQQLLRCKQNIVKYYNKKADQLTQSKYHKAEFYHDILSKHQESLALPSELESQKDQQQKQDLKEKMLGLQVLKQKQIYLSQMKILIELLQLDASILEANKFDLQKYKSLLGKKLQCMKTITLNATYQSLKSPEFLQIKKQISALTGSLDTTNLHIPYKYPIELLLTTKQKILEDHFTNMIKKLQKQLPQEISRTNKILQQKRQLQLDLAALKTEVELAREEYGSFTAQCVKKLKKTIRQQDRVGEILPLEVKQEQKRINQITNIEEIQKQSRLLFDNTPNKELVQTYEQIKTQSSNIMMEWFKLEQKYINPTLIYSVTKSKSHFTKNDKRTMQLQLELANLLKKAKRIFEYKQKKGEDSSFRKSNVGLYSSIY